ncbi:hypothetical protein D3C87_1294570 [compost metagenome]
MFEQCIQTPFGQHGLPLDDFQQGLLQFDVQRQLRMEFRWCCRVFAVIGLPESREPGFGQIDASLGQPQFTFDQSDHRQVVNRRHVPDMHQPLGFGKFGEGLGEFTAAAFKPGNHAVPDQHADVATGARFTQAGLQTKARRLRLQTQRQQETFVQREPRAYGIESLR